MEQKSKGNRTIDLVAIYKNINLHRKLYVKVLAITFVLACAWIFPRPRYYKSTVSLAPESTDMSAAGSLGSLASSFGLDLGSMANLDAIYPELYPDLLQSDNFLASLFKIQVETVDKSLKTDVYDYYTSHQKKGIWSYPILWVQMLQEKLAAGGSAAATPEVKPNGTVCVFTKKESNVINKLREKLKCDVDKKTSVVTITLEDQDKLICATLADSIRQHLQDFIIEYRTNKARQDAEYYGDLCKKAKKEYELARQRYGMFADSNQEVSLQSLRSKTEDMENDMQLKYNAYTSFYAQYHAALAKVQEKTPAFTVIQAATVPQKPAGPKRLLFVLGMMVLAFLLTTAYVSRNELFFYENEE